MLSRSSTIHQPNLFGARIFRLSVGLHGESVLEDVVHVDTTVQEMNITYPTDSKLEIKIINRLNKIARSMVFHSGVLSLGK